MREDSGGSRLFITGHGLAPDEAQQKALCVQHTLVGNEKSKAIYCSGKIKASESDRLAPNPDSRAIWLGECDFIIT